MKIQSPRLMLGFKNKPLQEAPQKYVQRDLEMSLFFELILGKKQILSEFIKRRDLSMIHLVINLY